MDCFTISTPFSPVSIVIEEECITNLRFAAAPSLSRTPPPPLYHEAAKQLEAYFSGRLQQFSLPLQVKGTAFQQTVWRSLLDIPYGTTCSYEELAKKVGCPSGFRAVGNANGKNPLPLLLPCHRVTPKKGGVGGYLGGTHWKSYLLALESNANSHI